MLDAYDYPGNFVLDNILFIVYACLSCASFAIEMIHFSIFPSNWNTQTRYRLFCNSFAKQNSQKYI